jgi:hypothetical protein
VRYKLTPPVETETTPDVPTVNAELCADVRSVEPPDEF